MSEIFKFHAGSKTFFIFKKHFIEGGSLYNTKLAAVIAQDDKDDNVFYDNANNDVYLNCSEEVLRKIADFTYEKQLDYLTSAPNYLGKNTLLRGGKNTDEINDSNTDNSNDTYDTNDINNSNDTDDSNASNVDDQYSWDSNEQSSQIESSINSLSNESPIIQQFEEDIIKSSNTSSDISDEEYKLEKMFKNIDTVASPPLPELDTNELLGGKTSQIENLVNTIHDNLNNELSTINSQIEKTTELNTDIEYNALFNTDTVSVKSKYIDIN